MEKESFFTNNKNQNETLEPILSKIMTAEEYGQTKHATPYVFELKDENKKLNYFGSPHVRDPKNPLFKKLEENFNQTNPDMVFVEGMNIDIDKKEFNEKIKNMTREEIINRMGESGFTLKLCVEKGIDWDSPEPTDKDLYSHLLNKGFSKEQIFAYDVFRMLPQYNRQTNKGGFEQYISNSLKQFKQATNWDDFNYSYDHSIEIGEQILGKSIDVENEPGAGDFVDPIPWNNKKEKQTILNRVNEASSFFRDQKIVSEIAESFKTHNNIFIVYGASHAVMQEPALRDLFNLNKPTNQ